jgi:hypothetical protein
MGGRIASQVAAASAPGVEGLVFLGYPLHPPGRADQLRAKPTVMSPRFRKAPGTLAFLSIICETTAAPPRSQPIRRAHCRGHRFRYLSIGRNFHPDSVQTTSLSETYCTGFHLSNEILGRASSRFVSGYRGSSMPRDGNEQLPSGWPSYAQKPRAVNCGTRNQAAAAARGIMRANLNLLPDPGGVLLGY